MAWPEQTIGDIVGEPAFGQPPVAVHDCEDYIIVSYDNVATDAVNAYVDGIAEEGRLFAVYDNRKPYISSSFSDDDGNSVTIVQMPDPSGGTMTSITIIRVDED